MYGNERGASPGRLRCLMAGTLGGAPAVKRRAAEVERKPGKKGRWEGRPAVAATGSKIAVVTNILPNQIMPMQTKWKKATVQWPAGQRSIRFYTSLSGGLSPGIFFLFVHFP